MVNFKISPDLVTRVNQKMIDAGKTVKYDKVKEEIQNLIQQHTLGKQECWELLQELNKVDEEKLSVKEIGSLRMSILAAEMEYNWRQTFLCELKDIMD